MLRFGNEFLEEEKEHNESDNVFFSESQAVFSSSGVDTNAD